VIGKNTVESLQSGAVLDACETVQRHDPWLTLYGLRIIWDRNQEPGGGRTKAHG
jgi:pantothenate kinase type III